MTWSEGNLDSAETGINYDGYSRLARMNVIQQASFVSINGGLTTVTPCDIPPCLGYPGCHPGDMFPYDIPILTPFCGPKHSQMSKDVRNKNSSLKPQPLSERRDEKQKQSVCNPKSSLKPESLSERRDEKQKQSEPCQCSPEKIKEMLEQVIKGKASNLKTTECATDYPPTIAPTKPSTNQAAYNKRQPRYIKPAFKPLCSSGNDKDACGNYPNQNINEKVKCACSGRERTVTIGSSLCPCEQYQPPVSMTTFGPKSGTRSLGCQCCSCDDSMVQAASDLEFPGPTGGVCQMEPGGASCQAGRKPKPKVLDAKRIGSNCECVLNAKKIGSNCECVLDAKKIDSNCDCAINGKKNKNVICECPSEPEPVPEPVPEPLPEPVPEPEPDEYLPSSLYRTDQLVDQKEVLRQNSDMTQTQSGFRIFKKKKRPPPPEPKFTVEDAVRYYVAVNPDLLKELCPKPEPIECPCKEENLDAKKSRKSIFSRFSSKSQCKCPAAEAAPRGASKRVPTKFAHSKGAPPPEPEPEPEPEPKPEDEAPSGGIKFSIGGKGSSSKGLSGVCCFDMIQETNISRTK